MASIFLEPNVSQYAVDAEGAAFIDDIQEIITNLNTTIEQAIEAGLSAQLAADLCRQFSIEARESAERAEAAAIRAEAAADTAETAAENINSRVDEALAASADALIAREDAVREANFLRNATATAVSVPAAEGADVTLDNGNFAFEIPVANVGGALAVPTIDTLELADFVLVEQADDDEVKKITWADMLEDIPLGLRIRGEWNAATNTISGDPLNTSVTKGTAPTVPVGRNPAGVAFVVSVGGTFDIREDATGEVLRQGDEIIWTENSEWIIFRTGSGGTGSGAVDSVNGLTGDVTLTNVNVGAPSSTEFSTHTADQNAHGVGVVRTALTTHTNSDNPHSITPSDIGATPEPITDGDFVRRRAGANLNWVPASTGGGLVDSVNGAVGVVVLDAADVNALPTAGGTLTGGLTAPSYTLGAFEIRQSGTDFTLKETTADDATASAFLHYNSTNRELQSFGAPLGGGGGGAPTLYEFLSTTGGETVINPGVTDGTVALVWVNGVMQSVQGGDYTYAGDLVTLSTALEADERIMVTVW